METEEARERMTDASPKELQLLRNQTERTLDRHAEIQEEQRRQAIRILQAYVALGGVVIGLSPYVSGIIATLTLPSQAAFIPGVLGSFLIGSGFLMLAYIPGLIYGIPTPCSEVLSPEPLDLGPITRLLVWSGFGERESEAARAGVRTVTRCGDLEQSILGGSGGDIEDELILDRLSRIDRNEQVIEFNGEQLQDIYGRIVTTVELFAVGLFAVVIGMYLLGVRVG